MYPYRALEWYEEDLDNAYLEYYGYQSREEWEILTKGEENKCVLENLKQTKLSAE